MHEVILLDPVQPQPHSSSGKNSSVTKPQVHILCVALLSTRSCCSMLSAHNPLTIPAPEQRRHTSVLQSPSLWQYSNRQIVTSNVISFRVHPGNQALSQPVHTGTHAQVLSISPEPRTHQTHQRLLHRMGHDKAFRHTSHGYHRPVNHCINKKRLVAYNITAPPLSSRTAQGPPPTSTPQTTDEQRSQPHPQHQFCTWNQIKSHHSQAATAAHAWFTLWPACMPPSASQRSCH